LHAAVLQALLATPNKGVGDGNLVQGIIDAGDAVIAARRDGDEAAFDDANVLYERRLKEMTSAEA
jgi:hypothetical protein